jgi:hypothetical protein
MNTIPLLPAASKENFSSEFFSVTLWCDCSFDTLLGNVLTTAFEGGSISAM